MEQMTIKELSVITAYLVKKGYGDRKIVISDDNEGNGYHGLCFGFDVENVDEYVDLIYDSTTYDADKLAILG